MEDDKYPHWRDALFGNHNAVANLRCAAHYVFWHALYALVAVVGAAAVGAVRAAKYLASFLGPLAAPIGAKLDDLIFKIKRFANHRYVQNAAFILALVLLAALVLIFGWMLVTIMLTDFWKFVTALAIVVGGTIAIVAAFALLEYLSGPAKSVANIAASKANQAGQKATKTPGVRRVYGECPVSMDQAPKWFDDLFPAEDDL